MMRLLLFPLLIALTGCYPTLERKVGYDTAYHHKDQCLAYANTLALEVTRAGATNVYRLDYRWTTPNPWGFYREGYHALVVFTDIKGKTWAMDNERSIPDRVWGTNLVEVQRYDPCAVEIVKVVRFDPILDGNKLLEAMESAVKMSNPPHWIPVDPYSPTELFKK